jgi:hypothetical protein
MARFFFDVAVDGLTEPDAEGLDCFDASVVEAEAARAAAEMLKYRPPRDGSVTIIVRDQTDQPLFQVAASLQIKALGESCGDSHPLAQLVLAPGLVAAPNFKRPHYRRRPSLNDPGMPLWPKAKPASADTARQMRCTGEADTRRLGHTAPGPVRDLAGQLGREFPKRTLPTFYSPAPTSGFARIRRSRPSGRALDGLGLRLSDTSHDRRALPSLNREECVSTCQYEKRVVTRLTTAPGPGSLQTAGD